MVQPHNQKPLSPEVRLCCQYIDAHPEQKLDLDALARRTGYIKYYLSKKFAAEVGMNMRTYAIARKVERAKVLLTDTRMTVDAISQRLHFSSRSHFAAAFRKMEGISPSGFREKYQDKTSFQDPDI